MLVKRRRKTNYFCYGIMQWVFCVHCATCDSVPSFDLVRVVYASLGILEKIYPSLSQKAVSLRAFYDFGLGVHCVCLLALCLSVPALPSRWRLWLAQLLIPRGNVVPCFLRCRLGIVVP